MIELWRQIWEGRSGREKTLLWAAGIFLSMLLLWVFAYKPLSNYPAAQIRALKQAELDLKIMQKGQANLQSILQDLSASHVAKPVIKLPIAQFQSIVTGAAKDQNILISRRQPNGEGELTLWLENTESTAFYAWVNELTGGYNIELTRAQMYRNDDGSIRVMVTFNLVGQS